MITSQLSSTSLGNDPNGSPNSMKKASSAASLQISNQKTRLSVPAFLLKTYDMIENKEYQDILSWNNDGQSFVIKNINEFSEKVLANYFKHNNFASFVRQLNMYDFHKIRNENNETEFRHRLFKRGNKNLLIEIKRKSGEINGDEQPEQSGGQMSSIDFMEMERIKKDYSLFLSEVMSIKQKYSELDRIVHSIATQIDNYHTNKDIQEKEQHRFKELGEQQWQRFYYILSFIASNKFGSGNNNNSNANPIVTFLQNGPKETEIPSNRHNQQQQLNDHQNNKYFNYNQGNNQNNFSANKNNNHNTSYQNNNQNDKQKFFDKFNNQQMPHSHPQQESNIRSQENIINSLLNVNESNFQNSQNRNSQNQITNDNDDNQCNNNNNNNNNSNPSSLTNIPFNQNGEPENRIAKKHDWAAVQQSYNKDGDSIPVCPLPFMLKKKQQSDSRQKKMLDLMEMFRNFDVSTVVGSNNSNNNSNKMFNLAEEAANAFNLNNSAAFKKIFNLQSMNNNSQNNSIQSTRQSLSMFENNPFKRICGGGSNNNNNPSQGDTLRMQLGITEGTNKPPSLLDLNNTGDSSALNQNKLLKVSDGLSLPSNLFFGNQSSKLPLQSSNSNISLNNNNGPLAMFSPYNFNAGEASPRLGFNYFPSPNPNNGNGDGMTGNGFSQGLQSFLHSPTPNSPLLLKDMEEFITQHSINNYSMPSQLPQHPTIGQQSFGIQSLSKNDSISNINSSNTNNGGIVSNLASTSKQNSTSTGLSNIENNRRLANDLLNSFKIEAKSETKYG